MTLSVQSDCPDTDFVAKLIDLYPDGRAMLLMDGVIRAMDKRNNARWDQSTASDCRRATEYR
jgi:predicted acyl esterase